jgi:hypothetical protein
MDAAVLLAPAAAFAGVLLGAALTRRNDRRSRSDELLAEAVNDAVRAIAHVAASNSTDHQAQTDYAGAISRVAMHGGPSVVGDWRSFQDNATTETIEGRALLVAAVQATRKQLGHGPASDSDLNVLLFGPGGPQRQTASRQNLRPAV